VLIYPAIDLIDGACVRLRRGDFDNATVYEASPLETLSSYAGAGAEWVHIVDLDGAKAGAPRQYELIGALARETSLKIQAAGGVRSRDDAARLIESGASRVVIGSLAAKSPDAVLSILNEFGPERVTLAFDVRVIDGEPRVAVSGWRETSSLTLLEAMNKYPSGSALHILVTNVDHDGVMAGPDLALYEMIAAERPDLKLQGSGGVRDIADILALKRARADGAIVGRALYEGSIDLTGAIRAGA